MSFSVVRDVLFMGILHGEGSGIEPVIPSRIRLLGLFVQRSDLDLALDPGSTPIERWSLLSNTITGFKQHPSRRNGRTGFPTDVHNLTPNCRKVLEDILEALRREN
jgi:hypothetical protein